MAFPRLFIDQGQINYYKGVVPNTFGFDNSVSYRIINSTGNNGDEYVSLFTGKAHPQIEFNYNIDNRQVLRLIVKTNYTEVADLPTNFHLSITNHNFDDTIPVNIRLKFANRDVGSDTYSSGAPLNVNQLQLNGSYGGFVSVDPDSDTKNIVTTFFTNDSQYYEYLFIDIVKNVAEQPWEEGDKVKIGGIHWGEYYELPHGADITSEEFSIESSTEIVNEGEFYEYRYNNFETPDHLTYEDRQAWSLAFSDFVGADMSNLITHLSALRGKFISFLFQPNSGDDEFSLYRMTSNKIKRTTVAPNLYSINMSMIETW